MMIIQTLLTAIAYLFYHVQLFQYYVHILHVKRISRMQLLCTYLLNFLIFILCTLCHFHLIFNWLIVLLLLFIEIRILYRTSITKSLLLSLLGCVIGLALNIFFRSLFAILLRVPLSAFDNNIDVENMKAYPVLSGFFMAGVVIWLMKRYYPAKRIFMILHDHGNIKFLISLLAAMYIYLSLNLIVYYIGENAMIIKLWSMKSSIFVIVGEYLAITLSYKMAQLNEYRKENKRSQQMLYEEKRREQELRMIAVLDPLTGCENQTEALQYINKALLIGESFHLVFVDLNCLKEVNDRFGHEMGDRYLQNVCSTLRMFMLQKDGLYRYGGDEFILLFHDCTRSVAQQRMEDVEKNLKEASKEMPYAMSISYGIVESGRCKDVEALIHMADMAMYDMKQKMKKERPI